MDSEIEIDLSRMGTYFKDHFVQGIDEICLKYEAKLSFKTFNVEALERDELAQKDSLKYKEKVSLKESGLPLLVLLSKNKSLQQGNFLSYFLLLNFDFLNIGPTKIVNLYFFGHLGNWHCSQLFIRVIVPILNSLGLFHHVLAPSFLKTENVDPPVYFYWF